MNWGPKAQNPTPDWTMSAALENVPRGDGHLPEVTNLRDAVKTWQGLDPSARATAILTLERPIVLDGAQLDRFEGRGIAALAERLTG
jgi:hypothetical protein